MEVKVIDRDQIMLAGFSFYGDPFETSAGWTEENEIGRLWVRFMTYCSNHPQFGQHFDVETTNYELHIEHDETSTKGFYEVFVGVQAESLEHVPFDVLVKILPATQYAVFTLSGEEITSDWNRMIYNEWLPGSGYKVTHPYSFQLYDSRFKGLDKIEESILDVYIPVAPSDSIPNR